MKRLALVLAALTLFAGACLAEDMPLIEWVPRDSELPINGEIGESWEEIIAYIDDGSARERYAIGAWKPLDLGQYGVVNMQLAGFELDERADGRGKAATTWIAKELLAETHCMHTDWQRYDGWESCELRQWLQNEILESIPDVVRARIIAVWKSQKYFRYMTTKERVWIPARKEVFGTESIYHDLFKNEDMNRVKTRNGAATWWWLRSADSVAVYYQIGYADGVGYDGYNYNYSVTNTYGGVVLGFCL